MSTVMPCPDPTTTSEFDLHPFTGSLGRPIDALDRGRLARLTPLQEAVWRLRRGIGTAKARSPEELAALLSMPESEVRKIESQAARRLSPRARRIRRVRRVV